MEIVNLDTNVLVPYEKNAKKHTDRQVTKVAESIKRFGFVQPIVVTATNDVVIGHCRLLAAKMIGLPVVPCVKVESLTDAEIKALRLADNKLNESAWDMAAVIAEGKELDSELQLITGFDPTLFLDSDEDEDTVPETPTTPVSKAGDLYQLGTHYLLVGDSTKGEDVRRLMGETKADMVFTDPPYNVNYKGQSEKTNTGIENDHMSKEAFDDFLSKVFSCYADSIKAGGGMYVFHSTSTQAQFQKAIEDAGFQVRAQLIWNKPSAALGWGDYRWKHEPFFYCGVKDQKSQFYGDRTHATTWDHCESEEELVKWAKREKKAEEAGRTTVWTMKRDNVNEYVHPTQKPVQIAERAILNSSKAGDVVLDLFLGSGSTLIAAEKTGRRCFGMEMDPKYADVIVKRWMEYTKATSVKRNGEDVTL